jgi:acetyl coenzyme A synthetase (ADP forming)-like protein
MSQLHQPPHQAPDEEDILLRDGSTVHLRPMRSEDGPLVRALYSRMSAHSRYMRFHHQVDEPPEQEMSYPDSADARRAFALVATLGDGAEERVIAVGRYARAENEGPAEVAFAVEDSHQGRGIASRLLDQLANVARANGIEEFTAEVLGENRSMMDVFRDSGYPVKSRLKYGTMHVAFPIAESAEAERRAAEREAQAAAASIRPFFQPRSVAVIGASRERGTFGAEVLHNIVKYGFTGAVYPVNPSAETIEGLRAYASVRDVPGDVELAVVVVPAAKVLGVVDECAARGVRGIVVISAGFKETGAEGRELEVALLRKVRGYGMRMVGPNCMGLVNANPSVSLNATFAPAFPRFGNVGLASQSGALGLALLDYSRDLNIGLSTFVSVGNKADVSSNDLIEYWEQDADTDVILLYIESFGNPRRFARLAKRIASKKPIVAVKSGRSAAGSRAAKSHTGALATLDVASDALFRQAGVIRVDTLEELFDAANLLAHQPVPKGRRVAILTNAGGPGILAADACEANGLEVVALSDETRAKLAEFLPREAGLSNPVDMIASAGAEHYERALRILVEDESFDSVIVIFIPPLVTQAVDVASAIRSVAPSAGHKTLLACFMSTKGAPPELTLGDIALPSYIFPESAAQALARVSEYAEWRKRPAGTVPAFSVDSERARRIVAEALAGADEQGVWLSPDLCCELLECYGIRSAQAVVATTPAKAVAAAEKMGYPVAVKLASRTITHKADVGGVVLNVGSAEGVQAAFESIRGRLAALGRESEMDGVVVQQMLGGVTEAIIGVTLDKTFGPLVMFGLGGTFVELMKDVAFRIQPITDVDAREMVRSIKGFPLLQGWRGASAGDVQALEETLLRVSCLVEDLPEIAEMDLNPVKVLPPGEGCVTVDARVLLKEVG